MYSSSVVTTHLTDRRAPLQYSCVVLVIQQVTSQGSPAAQVYGTEAYLCAYVSTSRLAIELVAGQVWGCEGFVGS